jgi:hypothetical protein
MIANNPRSRLHSQLDVGKYSQASKIQGREPIRMHPDDAAERGIYDIRGLGAKRKLPHRQRLISSATPRAASGYISALI